MFGVLKRLGQLGALFPDQSATVVLGPPPDNGYVAEDGSTYYVAEDGVTYYVQE